MDPLSVTASVAGIATAVFQVVQFLSQIKAGGRERLSLCQEVTHLWLSITSLQQQLAPDSLLDDKIPPHLLPLFADDGILHDIETEIQKLDDKLRAQSTHGKLRQTLTWPLTQPDVLQAIERVHRLQATLHLALTQSTHALTQDIYRDGHAAKQTIDENRKKEIIEWVSPLDFLSRQRQIFKEHHEGTCKWFLSCDDFHSWRKGDGRVLFGPGIPGAGKTFLASIVVQELERLRTAGDGGVQDAAIVALYCKWDNASSQGLEHLVSSVMKQLLQKYPVLTQSLVDKFSRHLTAGTHPDQAEMLEVLTEVLGTFPKVFVVVDGLDELREEKHRAVLLQTLKGLHPKVNLMVTARPLHGIRALFRAEPVRIYCDGCGKEELLEQMHCDDCEQFATSYDLCQSCFDQGTRCPHPGHIMTRQFNAYIVEVTAVPQDLKTYVESRISSSDFLQRCVESRKGLGSQILDRVVGENGGMFLLARFNMDTLESKLNTRGVLKALETLPKELEGTYTAAMDRISALPTDIREPVLEFLRWVIFAKEPLTDDEIEHALAVSTGDEDIDRDNIIRAQTLADKCAGLVHFDEWDCARLVHFSVQNYFTENRERWFPEGSTGLASTCLTYLLFEPFKAGACSGLEESAEFDARIESYPFLQYAAVHWGKHLLDTPSEELYGLARRLLQDEGCAATTTQVLWYLDDEGSDSWAAKTGSSALHLATHFALDRLMEELLAKGIDPDTPDANGATALLIAAGRGSDNAVKLLLQHGAAVNRVDNIGTAPLHEATSHNHGKVVRLLLKAPGVDVNIANPGRQQYTALHLAAKKGYTDIVTLLLASPQLNVNQECQGVLHSTALTIAANYDEPDIVRALLRHPDIAIDHQSYGGDTALILAASNGYYPIVEALLDKGANTEVLQDGTEGTALLRAIDANAIPVVQLLLDRGANVHHLDCFGRGMLHGAACNNRAEILRLLLESDSTLDVNLQDVHGKTTLHDVARLQGRTGAEATAEVLLEYGADPTIRDMHGRTPIRIAREINSKDVLDLLLEAREKQKQKARTSADPATPNPPPQRTFTGSSIRGVARSDTLLSMDDTPVALWALANAEAATDEIRERLAQSPADINLTDPDMGQAALHYAAAVGDAETTKLLIEHGADINLRNRYGRTPLNLTTLGGYEEAAAVLLEAGADVNIPDQWGCGPLVNAFYERSALTTLLVEKGADLSNPQLDLNYLLGYAAFDGNEVAVRRLVEAGADVWRKNDAGETPYSIAKFNSHEGLAALILQLAVKQEQDTAKQEMQEKEDTEEMQEKEDTEEIQEKEDTGKEEVRGIQGDTANQEGIHKQEHDKEEPNKQDIQQEKQDIQQEQQQTKTDPALAFKTTKTPKPRMYWILITLAVIAASMLVHAYRPTYV